MVSQDYGPQALSHEDQMRMERLSFEIAERVHNIGRLLASTLEVSNALPVKRFILSTGNALADTPSYDLHEVTFADGSKGCHDYVNNMSCMGGCPCA